MNLVVEQKKVGSNLNFKIVWGTYSIKIIWMYFISEKKLPQDVPIYASVHSKDVLERNFFEHTFLVKSISLG